MKPKSGQDLVDQIELVKWQNNYPTQKYNLLTVHSLLIDDHPKFKQLKQLVKQFNETIPNKIQRPNLKPVFIGRLYKMLCQLVRIPKSQNQLTFLDKIYQWATVGNNLENNNSNNSKMGRPTTASTKTRPYSAYSRPFSGRSKQLSMKTREEQTIEEYKKIYPKIDFNKLQIGQIQYFQGTRTIHKDYQHPKKRLKQYRRKIFQDDYVDSDQEIIDIDQPLKDIHTDQLKKLTQPQQQIQQQQKQQGQGQQQQGVIPGQQQINIDDIPLDIGQVPQEQQVQKIDKLKPHVKVYQDFQNNYINKKQYQRGTYKQQIYKNKIVRQFEQDKQFIHLLSQWGRNRGNNKKQMNRKSQSVRMVRKKIGLPTQTIEVQNKSLKGNTIDLTSIKSVQLKSKTNRPRTAFYAQTTKQLNQKIQNAFFNGKLNNHVNINRQEKNLESMASHAPKIRKSTFQQILSKAQQQVYNDSHKQVMLVKQKLATNKISLQADKIAKSISYHQVQLPNLEFTGQITGVGMLKNPFFKVAKKKKKKKKK